MAVKIGVAFTSSHVFHRKQWTFKEKLYVGLTQIPKAAVQASLSSFFLQTAKDYGLKEYYSQGEAIQTTAILSIIICAPIGAVLLNSLYPVMLRKSTQAQDDLEQKIEKADDLVD